MDAITTALPSLPRMRCHVIISVTATNTARMQQQHEHRYYVHQHVYQQAPKYYLKPVILRTHSRVSPFHTPMLPLLSKVQTMRDRRGPRVEERDVAAADDIALVMGGD
jgi:hypothetical protein